MWEQKMAASTGLSDTAEAETFLCQYTEKKQDVRKTSNVLFSIAWKLKRINFCIINEKEKYTSNYKMQS